MNRNKLLGYSLLTAASLVSPKSLGMLSGNHSNYNKPNIVFILVDDMGYSDLGCYGNDFCETPHIDRLASEGLKFRNAYAAAPICSPSRAAFLTGRSPARLGFEFVTKWENDRFEWNEAWAQSWAGKKLIPPPYRINLPLNEVTIPEVLKSAGYVTGIAGKWHVAGHHGRYNGWSLTHGPLQQGFDWAVEAFGSHPYSYSESANGRFGPFLKGVYPEDDLTANAIGFMQENRDNPFFLYISHHYVHTPLNTRCEWLLDKYRAKALGKYTEDRILYGAFIETLDHYVGQLLNAIENLGIVDNTMVVLTSDNGGHPEFAFNAPLRGSKWNLYEGGVRVPMIVRWPNQVAKGTTSDTPIIGMDFMPTFREMAGIASGPELVLDGMSILPVLNEDKPKQFTNRSLYWHFPNYHPETNYDQCRSTVGIEDGDIGRTAPQSSIRVGDFKLIYFYETGEAELYNLAEDVSEQNDINSQSSRKSNELLLKLFDHLKAVNARLPQKNTGFKANTGQ